MRKRFLLISTIIVLSAFTFAACGKKSPSSPESTNSETTTAEPTTEENTEKDTTEEEKENARRLHALKMLEKYYIYLNEDDLRCLEAMLQDCKRRKMEYGALDCGSDRKSVV